MAEALALTWEAISAPKFLILCGSCAISGGMFADGSLDRSWLDTQTPILFIPGCPVHPLSIVQGLASLMGFK
jgi:NADH:ubiquinone oxidoreductase subunit B-like Fe-S oxidoreductase